MECLSQRVELQGATPSGLHHGKGCRERRGASVVGRQRCRPQNEREVDEREAHQVIDVEALARLRAFERLDLLGDVSILLLLGRRETLERPGPRVAVAPPVEDDDVLLRVADRS